MKNRILKTLVATTLAIISLTFFGHTKTVAQDVKEFTAESADRRGGDRALEGSWDIQVTRRDCQTGGVLNTFPTMTTFAAGGTMQDYGVFMSPTGRGPGHGVWRRQSGRRFTAAFRFFLFGADGVGTGKQIVRRQIELDASGNNYTATGVAQVFNTSGALTATVCTTETGTRFE